MKRFLLFITLTTLFFTGLTSCNKCYTCDFGNNDVREYCSKDFPDKTEGLNMTIKAYEEQGYKCSAK